MRSAQITSRRTPLRRGFIIQVDFTYRCNLRCKHCYFYIWQENRCELGDQEMLAFLHTLRAKHDPRICIFLGGEPLLRCKLLLKAVELFPVSWERHPPAPGVP